MQRELKLSSVVPLVARNANEAMVVLWWSMDLGGLFCVGAFGRNWLQSP
jgi:hypothetical protein